MWRRRCLRSALPTENFPLTQLVSLFLRFGVAVPTATELWYAANPRFVNRSQKSRPLRGHIRQGEKKDENQVTGRRVDGVVLDRRSCPCSGARSDAGGERQSAAISGNDEEECSGGHERTVGGAVELQTGAGPLVSGAGDGAHRRSGGLHPRNGEGKIDDGAGRRAGARREQERRCRAVDGSGTHKPNTRAWTARADTPCP